MNNTKEKKTKDNFYAEAKAPIRPIFIALGILSVIIIVTLTVLVQRNFNSKGNNSSEKKRASNDIILKVGEEYIYQKDKEYELSQMPKIKNSLQDEAITEKLINDSVVLQQAGKEKLITLDSKIYNSLDKNYDIRLKTIKTLRASIDENVERIQGTLVTIWFNNSVIPAIGIEKAKEITKEKISQLQRDVVNKTKTPDEAIAAIRKDTSLEGIDAAYQSNAGNKFTSVRQQKITIDKDFDALLWTLDEGEVTPVVELKGTNTDPNAKEGVLYAFGAMESRTKSQQTKTFEQWQSEHKESYNVVKY